MKTDNALLMFLYKKKFFTESMTASTSTRVVTIAPTYRYYLMGTTIKA